MPPTLDDFLSQADQDLLVQCLASVTSHRFGEVHLVVDQGVVKFIRPEPSIPTAVRLSPSATDAVVLKRRKIRTTVKS